MQKKCFDNVDDDDGENGRVRYMMMIIFARHTNKHRQQPATLNQTFKKKQKNIQNHSPPTPKKMNKFS